MSSDLHTYYTHTEKKSGELAFDFWIEQFMDATNYKFFFLVQYKFKGYICYPKNLI
jgi:hypothetical protein